jgi:hypothetical protein
MDNQKTNEIIVEEIFIIPDYDKEGNSIFLYCKKIVIPGQTHFCDFFDEKVEIGF